METYLPIIQATLAEWLQLTLDHPLYAVSLAISIWLLTAILYSIRISGLNKKNVASEKTRTAAEANLNTAQQQLQQAQDELATVTVQLGQSQRVADTEKQRALSSEQQQTQRNQQIASIIQQLASNFDIGERPLPVTEDLKADDLWQQHDKVVKQFIENLRAAQLAKTELEKFYQAEKSKLAEAEIRLSSLQVNLDSQTSLIATLQTQNTTLQQQQQDLTDALRKQQADLVRLVELERQVAQFSTTKTQLEEIKETLITPVETIPAQIDTVKQATLVTTNFNEASLDDAAEKLKSLFKKSNPSPISEQNVIAPPTTDTTPLLAETKQTETKPVLVSEPVPAPIEETAEKASKDSALKGLYQKFTTTKTEPVVETKPASVEEPAEKNSALKGFYQKFTTTKTEPAETATKPIVEAKPASAAPVEDTTEKTIKDSALKGLYQKFTTTKTEPVVETKPEQLIAKPAQAEVIPEPKPEPRVEPVAKTIEETAKVAQPKKMPYRIKRPEVKPLAIEPSSRIDEAADLITDKVESLKNLYGKFFSKDK